MPNLNYERGRQAEYYIKHVLEKAGFLVTRAAASLGVYDLVALGADGVVAVQAKRGKTPPPRSEWEVAASAALHVSIVRMVVWLPDAHVSGAHPAARFVLQSPAADLGNFRRLAGGPAAKASSHFGRTGAAGQDCSPQNAPARAERRSWDYSALRAA